MVVNDSIVTTAMHRFFVRGRWVAGDQLSVGDELMLVSYGDGAEPMIASTAVNHLEARPGRTTTYNFEVARLLRGRRARAQHQERPVKLRIAQHA